MVAVVITSLFLAATALEFLTRDDPTHDWDALWLQNLQLTDMTAAISGGLACWEGGAYVRSHTGWVRLTGTRGPLATAVLALAPAVLRALTAFALLSAVLFLTAWSHGPAGSPPYAAFFVGATTVAAFACLGHLVGRIFPQRAMAPLVSLALLFLAVTGTGMSVCPRADDCRYEYNSLLLPHADWIVRGAPGTQPWLFCTANLAATAVCLFLCGRHWFLASATATVSIALLGPVSAPHLLLSLLP